MITPKQQLKLAYQFTTVGAVLYFASLLLGLGLVLSRKVDFWQSMSAISSWHVELHIYNFAACFMFITMIGSLWLIVGARFKYVALLAGVLALINIVYECFVPLLNTIDPVDAMYGVVGCIVALAIVAIMQQYGLQKVKK